MAVRSWQEEGRMRVEVSSLGGSRTEGTWEEEGGGQQPGWQQGCVELA